MKKAKEPITNYHWIVVIIASLGWLFDCMDQRLFALSRESAIAALLGPNATRGNQKRTDDCNHLDDSLAGQPVASSLGFSPTDGGG